MKNIKNLLVKMLLLIGIPVALIFCITIAFVLSTLKKSVNVLTINELTAKSQAASYQISNYFLKYSEVTKQMAANSQFESLFVNTVPGKSIISVDGFADVKSTLDNVKKTDPENIVVSWLADFDSSQFTQSDGYVSGADWVVTTRSWYQQLMKEQNVIITEPYLDTASKQFVVSVVAPVYQSGTKNIIGVTGIDFSLENLYKMVSQYKLGDTGFYMLTTASGQFIYHPDSALKEKKVTEANMSQNITDAILNKTNGPVTYDAMNNKNYGYVSTVGDTGWTVITGLPEKEFNKTYSTVFNSVFIISAFAFVIMLLILILISNSIVKPLKKLKTAALNIADGNLNVNVEVKSKDEIGQVASAFAKTVERLNQYINYIDEVSSVLDEIALGNLAFELHCDYVGEFAKIKTSLENIKVKLISTFSEIGMSAEQVASGSEQVSNASQALAQGATEQASAIEQLSATITEIEAHVNRNAKDAATANDMAIKSSTEVEHGNQQMEQMITAINEIKNTSNQISKIIKTIDDIAFQTNILALNAAVEAARAGVAGKGFAVVADEVRSLASKSAEAAKNTTSLIENSIKAIESGTAIAEGTALSFNNIIASVKQTSELIINISNASNEQAVSISQVTDGVGQISAVVQTNSATSEESAASSEELNLQAHKLKELVSYFKIDINDNAGNDNNKATAVSQNPEIKLNTNKILLDSKY